MIIDRVLPTFHHTEHHSIRIRATPEHIYDVLRHGRLPTHPVVRLLIFLRGLGGKPSRTFSLEGILRQGNFHLLAEDPPRELVLGIEGPFWKPSYKACSDAASFNGPVPSGVARAAWNFVVGPDGTVSTETRILCGDDARRKFAVYWLFVRPFSGLIRRFMLRALRDACTQKT